MKYKGFVIEPVYMPGTDFKISKNGIVTDRKQKSADVAYFSVRDPLDKNRQFCADSTIAKCKQSVNELLVKLGMKSNTLSEWRKLDGCPY